MSSPGKVGAYNSNGNLNLNQRNYNPLNIDNNYHLKSNANPLQSEILNMLKPDIRYLNKPADSNPIASGAFAVQNNLSPLQHRNNINNNLNHNNNYNNYNSNSFAMPNKSQQFIPQQNQVSNASQHQNHNILNVSLEEILTKIRQKLAQRGITGILSIGKSFKINDVDHSRSISFAEFSNLFSKYGLGLSGNEVRSAFALFDKRRNGTIDYEEFLSALRGGLNSFRRSLVEQAFKIMDKNKNGFIDYNDIISAFDATKHPAVASGERSAESVYNEFLASFSMNHSNFAMNKGNFKISKEEWIEYYENVSMSIDDDAYFEVMINNCWRMNSHSMQNNNIKGWVGKENIDGVENAAALQESYNRRYNNISFGQNRAGYNILTNKIPIGGNPNNANNHNNNNFANQNNRVNNLNSNNFNSNNNNYNYNYNNETSVNPKSDMNNMNNNSIIFPPNTIQKNNINNNANLNTNIITNNALIPVQQNQQRTLEKGQAVLEKFRTKLFSRGSNSLITLARQFKIIDDDNSKSLSYDELVKVVKDFRIDLTQSETLALFNLFDRNRNNAIDYDEFLRAIKGEMSEKRKALVHQVFSVLDSDKSGVIDIQDLKNKYNMRKNPDVLSGRKSEEEAYGEFLQTLEFHFNIYKGKMDRKITQDEFIEYYNNISCSIDSDEYFETMIKNAWNIDKADYNKMQKGWVADYDYNKEASGFNKENLANNHSGNVNGININQGYYGNVNGNINYLNNNNNNNFAGYNYQSQQSNLNGFNKNVLNPNNYNNNYNNPSQSVGLIKQSSMGAYNNYVNDPIMLRLREKILSRGVKGIIGIQRSFKIADRNRTGFIDNEELIKLLKNYRFELTDVEFRKLFEIFDSNRNGKVDFNEFLYAIVGEMNEFRKNLVKKAFLMLDKTGNGRIDIDDIRGSFSAKMHPDVKNGKKTEDEVLSSFLDNFETHFSFIVMKILFTSKKLFFNFIKLIFCLFLKLRNNFLFFSRIIR